MPADLVGGGYQLYNPIWSFFNRTPNATQGNVAVRSNLEYLGLGAKFEASSTITSEKGLFAAIPVTWGDVISNVWIQVQKESESGAEFIAALYEGVAPGKETKVFGESAVIKEELKKEKSAKFALKSSQLITPTNAPGGYIYAGFFSKETTVKVEVSCVKIEKKFGFLSATAKEPLGPFFALTEASTGSFASAKSGFKAEEANATTTVPVVWLT